MINYKKHATILLGSFFLFSVSNFAEKQEGALLASDKHVQEIASDLGALKRVFGDQSIGAESSEAKEKQRTLLRDKAGRKGVFSALSDFVVGSKGFQTFSLKKDEGLCQLDFADLVSDRETGADEYQAIDELILSDPNCFDKTAKLSVQDQKKLQDIIAYGKIRGLDGEFHGVQEDKLAVKLIKEDGQEVSQELIEHYIQKDSRVQQAKADYASALASLKIADDRAYHQTLEEISLSFAQGGKKSFSCSASYVAKKLEEKKSSIKKRSYKRIRRRLARACLIETVNFSELKELGVRAELVFYEKLRKQGFSVEVFPSDGQKTLNDYIYEALSGEAGASMNNEGTH